MGFRSTFCLVRRLGRPYSRRLAYAETRHQIDTAFWRRARCYRRSGPYGLHLPRRGVRRSALSDELALATRFEGAFAFHLIAPVGPVLRLDPPAVAGHVAA